MEEKRKEKIRRSLETVNKKKKKKTGKTAAKKTAAKKTVPKTVPTTEDDDSISSGLSEDETTKKTVEVRADGEATISKHSYDKEEELYTVWVTWNGTKKCEWMYLHDMWVDYPEEVKRYQKQKKIKKTEWGVPNLEDASFVARILSMDGTVPTATFDLIFNNGYVARKVSMDEAMADAPDLLQEFLTKQKIENSG